MKNKLKPEPASGNPAVPSVAAQVSVRNGWLVLLTSLAVLYALHWASPILIPVMLGVMISYALSPLVGALEKWRVHRAIGAAAVLLGLVAGAGSLVYSLSDEAAAIVETMPDAARKFREALRAERGGANAIEKVKKAAQELESAASENSAAAPRGVTRVQVEKPKFDVGALLWSGTMGALTFIGQLVTVLFFAYFLMAAGDKYRRKMIAISGRQLSDKKVTLEVLNEITQQIQRYLLVQLCTSVVVGVASWLAFAAIGLEHAATWGIAAGVLNSVPYFGPVIVSCGIALVAFVQFGTFGMAFSVAGIALAITSIEGYMLTPWLIGQTGRINALVVFASVIVGGWLWGPWGLLLGVPVAMMLKAVCDRVEQLKPVGELIGD